MQNNIINTVCWVDFNVTNLQEGADFFSAVLDAPIVIVKEQGFEFALLPHENDNVAGCLVKAEKACAEDGPLVYLNVNGRIDDAIKAVKDNGGEIVEEKLQMGPYGVRAVARHPVIGKFALWSQS